MPDVEFGQLRDRGDWLDIVVRQPVPGVGFAVIGFTLIRVVFTIWLRRLGGVPLEYRKK